jgi:hypothetical protein
MRTLSFLTLLMSLSAIAGGPVTWRFGTEAGTDKACTVTLTAECGEGWHIYALELPRDDGPLPTLIRIFPNKAFTRDGGIIEPTPVEVDDPNFGMRVRYHSATTTFMVPVQRLIDGSFEVKGEVEYMVCNDKTCLPPTVVPFSVSVPALPK